MHKKKDNSKYYDYLIDKPSYTTGELFGGSKSFDLGEAFMKKKRKRK